MNTTDKSRADALTEAQRKALETAVNVLNINWEHETANELWEAFTAPVSQPAAAPVDTLIARPDPLNREPSEYASDMLKRAAADSIRRENAPAPADERAAFPRYTEWLHLRTHGEWSNGVPEWARDHTGRMNDCTAASAVIEELAAARASANEATRPTAYHFHRFVDGVEMAEGVLIERAPTLEAAIKEAVRCCEKRPMTVLVHAPAWAGTLCGGALANRAASANETGAEGAAVAWMSIDDPRDCISDAKKRDMIEHAGAPGARLAEKYSIALGVITPAQAAEPCAWLVEWTPNVSDKVWAQSFVNELDAINKQRQVGGRIIACAPINALSHAPAQAAEPMPAPAGWKLVPVAPTFEMCRAMEEAIDAGWKDSIVWARGIAAAPQPPAQADAQSDKG